MPHVDIKPAAVEEETAIAGRLLVVAVMQIDDTRPGLLEEVVLDAGRPHVGAPMATLPGDEATELGFNSDDAIHDGEKSGLRRIVRAVEDAWNFRERRVPGRSILLVIKDPAALLALHHLATGLGPGIGGSGDLHVAARADLMLEGDHGFALGGK